MDTQHHTANTPLHWLLRVATFLTLSGIGWLYLRWDSPLRGLLWHEAWMTKPVEYLLDLTWAEYTAGSDAYLSLLFRAIGVFLMISGVAALFVTPARRRLCDLVAIASLFTLLHAFSAWMGKDWQIGMLIELALQAGSPILLLIAIRRPLHSRTFLLSASILISFTFVGHGLYAVGYHPVPANFVSMTTNLLKIPESQAIQFLKLMGYLDFLAVLLIILPFRSVRIAAFFYMTFWGLITAIARIAAHYNPAEKYHGIDPWLAETLLRSSHWAVPLIVALTLCKREPDTVRS